MINTVGRKATGFTIIEIVLVLAIAGLIFLVVFLALRTVRVTVRDNQRKQDLANLTGAIQQWRTNNRAENVDSEQELEDVVHNYYKDQKDPSTGDPYDVEFMPSSTPHGDVVVSEIGDITYVAGHICGSDDSSETLITSAASASHSIRNFAVLTKLETGGVYCLDVR